jgi:hypothetical protein
MTETALHFAPLATRLEWIDTLAGWFEAEWPDYYGPAGRADARHDLRAYAQADTLPFGLVAMLHEVPCGVVAIKTEPFATHPQLHP